MPDAHDAMAAALLSVPLGVGYEPQMAKAALAALTAAGYAVVRVPEGVAVPHGARLVEVPNAFSLDTRLYAVEATP